jgi:3-oxoacyl-[acyl-carrier protein] reductase
MDLGLGGKVALVMGASQGLGRAVATELAAESANVAIASRSRENLAAVAAEIGATPFTHDNNDLDAVPAFVAAVAESLGPIEILVTNTGGPPPSPDPLAASPDAWEHAYRTLVLAPLALVRAVLPSMKERGWGRIVNLGSGATREPPPPMILSTSHRAATLAAFKTIAGNVAGDGITINTVLTGRILTDLLLERYGSREKVEEIGREVPAGRLGTPEELAAAVAFLCSTRASYITGIGLLIDGGASRVF